jgi:hypothetical protein
VEAQPLGGGRLAVTLIARHANCSPDNQLQSIQFTGLTNAIVELPGPPPTSVTAPGTVTLAGAPPSVTFTVRRALGGQTSTVQMVVRDGCGAWPTLVGGGAEAF